MKRTSISILAGLPLAVVAAVMLGGPLGVGALAGYLAGAAIGLLGAAWSRIQLRQHPDRFMAGSVMTFLWKLVGALLGALALRYVSELAAVADWRSFLFGYLASAYISLVFGALDGRRLLEQETVH